MNTPLSHRNNTCHLTRWPRGSKRLRRSRQPAHEPFEPQSKQSTQDCSREVVYKEEWNCREVARPFDPSLSGNNRNRSSTSSGTLGLG